MKQELSFLHFMEMLFKIFLYIFLTHTNGISRHTYGDLKFEDMEEF